MINFNLIFEGINQFQIADVIAIKDRWINLDISAMHPDSIMREIARFIDTLNLKSMDDLSVVINPNAGFIDPEMSKLFINMIAMLKAAWGEAETEEAIANLLLNKANTKSRY